MTRRKPAQGTKPAATRRVESNTRVVDAYRNSRVRRGMDPDDAWLVGAALDLKRDYLGSPNPGVWDINILTELLGDVVPRKVLLDATDRAVLVATVEDFLQFLADSGRWAPESFPARQIPSVIEAMRPDVERALTDPSRRSMTTNILQFGQAQGVDFSDRNQVQRFMDDYNALSQAERTQITEGRHPVSASPFGFAPSRPGAEEADELPDWLDDDDIDYEAAMRESWPAILGDPLDVDAMTGSLLDGPDIEERLATMDLPLLDRADQLMAWLGDGRPLTQTGAIRLAHTRELTKQFGLPDFTFSSMWDIPEVATPWSGLIESGHIDVGSSMARPSPDIPWAGPDADVELRAASRGSVVFAVLLDLFADEPDEGPLRAPLPALLALLKATQPSGLDVPQGRPGLDLLELAMGADLRWMQRIGLLTISDGVANAPAELVPLLLQLIEESGDLTE